MRNHTVVDCRIAAPGSGNSSGIAGSKRTIMYKQDTLYGPPAPNNTAAISTARGSNPAVKYCMIAHSCCLRQHLQDVTAEGAGCHPCSWMHVVFDEAPKEMLTL